MWADPEAAAAHWTDAATLDPDVLLTLLVAAQDICEAYAPAIEAQTVELVEDPPGSGLYTTGDLVENPPGSGLFETTGELVENPPGSGLWEEFPVPARYTLAVVLQARELWAASKRDGDVIGLGDGYALRSRPLTGAVKSLLRPVSGIPVLG